MLSIEFYEGIIPPTINTTQIDPLIPAKLNILTGKAIKKDIKYAITIALVSVDILPPQFSVSLKPVR